MLRNGISHDGLILQDFRAVIRGGSVAKRDKKTVYQQAFISFQAVPCSEVMYRTSG